MNEYEEVLRSSKNSNYINFYKMDGIVRSNYAKYIRAYLIKNGALKNNFATLTPTEGKITEYIKRINFKSKNENISKKAIENLFRSNVISPSIYTLNYIAELFEVEPYDIDEFNKAWNKGEIKKEDLLTPDNQENKHKYSKINSFIRNYNEIISDILPVFIGRKFVFDKVDEFISKNNKGYFFIKANPGIGKTSLTIKLVKEKKYPFHIINPQHNGTDNSVKDFISNICTQLIVKYKLPIEQFPDDYNNDGGFLYSVLRLVSEKNTENEKIVIVIDGLDELRQDELTFFTKETILYLPKLLPRNIFFILTMRKIDEGFKGIKLPTDEIYEDFLIEDNGKENIDDIKLYIEQAFENNKIQKYLKNQKISEKEFIQILEGKSEGNFMYLKHIFKEITKPKGDYTDKTLTELPQGLEEYYKEHWNRMMAVSDEAKEVKLKTIYVLSNMERPISREFLTEIIKSDTDTVSNMQIQEIIDDWRQFLNLITDEEGTIKYTFYHKSFLDFLASSELIKTVGADYSKIAEKVELDYYIKNEDEFLNDDFN